MSYAWTSDPIATPRFVLALGAVDAPVPPSAIVISVIPVISPPIIFTLLIFCVAIDPRFRAALESAGLFIVKLVPSPTRKLFFVGDNPERSSRSWSQAWTSVPIANPKFVLA